MHSKFQVVYAASILRRGAFRSNAKLYKLVLAQTEVAAGHIWMSELAKITLQTDVIQETETKQTVTRYTPLGVCVGIVPWNCRFSL